LAARKTHLLLSVFLFVFLSIQSFAQISNRAPSLQGPPVGPRDLSAFSQVVNIHGDDGFYLKKNVREQETWTDVNGESVFGTPFLFYEWYDGQLKTPDGRNYNYKLRYDVFSQTVSFINGNDSLDVNEDIGEFSLAIPVNDTVVVSRFVNANRYQKEQKTFYYEVELTNEKGELLKAITKKVATANGNDLLASKGKKYFDFSNTYYYYDKSSKKITKIKPTGSNITSMLNLDEAGLKRYHPDSYDFTKDDDLMAFFKDYFSRKAF
jgi:hypothetical protein